MRLFFILVVIATTMFTLSAQQTATLDDGRKVTLQDDGTWSYVEQAEAEPAAPVSYECADLVKSETDRVSGKTTVSSAESIIASTDGGTTGIAMYVVKGKKALIVSGLARDNARGCIDDGSKINILFRDGTRLEVTNRAKFNCKGSFTIYLGGGLSPKSDLEAFANKEIEVVRIWQRSNGYVEETFTPEQGKQFMHTVRCLSEM